MGNATKFHYLYCCQKCNSRLGASSVTTIQRENLYRIRNRKEENSDEYQLQMALDVIKIACLVSMKGLKFEITAGVKSSEAVGT